MRILCAAAPLISCGTLLGANYTWTGGSASTPPFAYSFSWSHPFNWDTSPPVSANTNDLFFGPAAGIPLTIQDRSDPFNLRSITITSPYTIDGGALRWDVPGSIQNNANLTMANAIVLGQTLTYDGPGSALLGGVISGPGGLTKNGT